MPDGKGKRLMRDLETNEVLRRKLDDPNLPDADAEGLVNAWDQFDNVGFDKLRKNPEQLQKFADLADGNNLGMSSDDLVDLLKAPQTKNLKWDYPENILDAVKRGSDTDIEGLSISHKKFPEPADGTDNFVLRNAKQYQKEASGDAGLSFNKNGVSFDDVATDGKLVDRKYGHGSSIFDEDGGVINEVRASSILKQAQRQLDAAGGDASKLRWEISTSEGAAGIEELFLNNNIDIEVKYVKQIEIK